MATQAATPLNAFNRSPQQGGDTVHNNFNDAASDHNDDDDDFDPFDIGSSASKEELRPASPTSGADMKRASSGVSAASKGSAALPPRMVVKFTVHEEVSSVADATNECEGASDVTVQGTVLAQVTCSDALKNSPFVLNGAMPEGSQKMRFSSIKNYSKPFSSTNADASNLLVVKIPKAQIASVPVGTYTARRTVDHMPLLLERKVTTDGEYVQLAVQVRSKLSNRGDLIHFSMCVSMSEKVIGESVQVMVGDGEWDEIKRTITWKLAQLPKGESFMVAAKAKLLPGSQKKDLKFPVLLRCSSSFEHISGAEFRAVEANGYPATVSFYTQSRSFRMLHRLK